MLICSQRAILSIEQFISVHEYLCNFYVFQTYLQSTFFPTYLLTYYPILHPSIRPSIHPPIYLSVHLSVCVYACIYLPAHPKSIRKR